MASTAVINTMTKSNLGKKAGNFNPTLRSHTIIEGIQGNLEAGTEAETLEKH